MLWNTGEASVRAAAADLDAHLLGPPTAGALSVAELDALRGWGRQVVVVDQIIAFTGPVSYKTFVTVPAGSLVILVQGNLQTSISVGGGAARMGIGWNDGGNTGYNKYGEYTAPLTKNAKVDKMPGSWAVLLVSETWQLTAMAATGGGRMGTIGAAGQSVRVRAVYLTPTSLASVP